MLPNISRAAEMGGEETIVFVQRLPNRYSENSKDCRRVFNKPSMLQHVEAGYRTKIDALNGALLNKAAARDPRTGPRLRCLGGADRRRRRRLTREIGAAPDCRLIQIMVDRRQSAVAFGSPSIFLNQCWSRPWIPSMPDG